MQRMPPPHEWIRYLLFLPVTAFSTAPPILSSKPWRVVGRPVARAIFCFTFDTPTARFSENDTPGIFMINTNNTFV